MDWILLLKKLVLALVQGVTEILPVSSSGHLLICSTLLNIDTNGLQYIIFLHFGSLVAMIVYYWKDIVNMIVYLCKYLFKKDRSDEAKYYTHLIVCLIIASIPAAIVGLLLNDIIDEYLSNLYFVFAFLSLTGVMLIITSKLKGNKTLKQLTFLDSLKIGCFQAVGVLPGVSRSGSTIFGGKVNRLSQEEAAHFSFLMFLPVTGGSFLLEVIKSFDEIIKESVSNLIIDIIGIIVAGLVTFFSVKFLFKIIKKGKLHYFAYYCFAVSIIGIITCLILHY